ncbi:aldo/keto reductase [Pseudohoeflea suaedae]|uniref:Aldo/keto reductase n=1 Tax=Pseudohoeflea suaedae TaxID=877384 RepID=A0A4R5PL95_9HYPH|nr:aldo/keto reductase [Pseudohoeflea suaedae]TDH37692.1 aldo/keto reductase [Pseudohoeflea suaedae]
MRKVRLGENGPLVGAVGLGCMSFGGIYGSTTREDSHATLKTALDLGVNHLDVANIYGAGVCEEVMGDFFRANGNRDQFVIATKGGIQTGPNRDFINTKAYLTACIDASLKRLGTDHVELYYIHRRDHRVPIEDVMETLIGFIEAGKIGAIGFSEIAPATLVQAAEIHPVAAVQSEYSLWTRLPELGMLRTCKSLGTSFVSFSPLGRGMLTDVELDPASFAADDFRKPNPRFTEPHFSSNVGSVRQLNAIARREGIPTATLALAWTFHRAEDSIAIPGTRSADHLTENAAAADFVLSSDLLDEIEDLLPFGWAEGSRYTEAQSRGVENSY